jgi:hypothetical protein
VNCPKCFEEEQAEPVGNDEDEKKTLETEHTHHVHGWLAERLSAILQPRELVQICLAVEDAVQLGGGGQKLRKAINAIASRLAWAVRKGSEEEVSLCFLFSFSFSFFYF